MSYALVTKARGLAEDADKLRRLPAVIAIIAERRGFVVETRDPYALIRAAVNDWARVTCNLTTGEFVYDSDYPSLLSIVREFVVERDGQKVLSDSYLAVDTCLAVKESKGWDYQWHGDSTFTIKEPEYVTAGLAL